MGTDGLARGSPRAHKARHICPGHRVSGTKFTCLRSHDTSTFSLVNKGTRSAWGELRISQTRCPAWQEGGDCLPSGVIRGENAPLDDVSAIDQVVARDAKRIKRRNFAREFAKSLVDVLGFIGDWWPS